MFRREYALLDDLVEFETGAGIVAAARQRGHPAAASDKGAFSYLDYLFWGRARSAPTIWVAGGLTRSGQSVTGSGLCPDHALWGIAGEVAECVQRGADTGPAPPIRGFGAHTCPELAAQHAGTELVERLVLRQWWDGVRDGRRLDACRIAQMLETAGMVRHQTRPLFGIAIAAAQAGHVVLAASFDQQGGAFCFGVACRPDPSQAFVTAALELAQAEFGLELAETKARRHGDAWLTAGDRANLRLAHGITRSRLMARADDGDLRGTSATTEDIAFTLRHIGSLDGFLHVVEARPLAPVSPTPSPALRPFGDLAPYPDLA